MDTGDCLARALHIIKDTECFISLSLRNLIAWGVWWDGTVLLVSA